MKRTFGLWLFTCAVVFFVTVVFSNFSYGGEPDRNAFEAPVQVEPKTMAPPILNPPVVRQYPPGCDTHAKVDKLLKETHKEIPLVIGVTKGNYLLEIYGSSFQDGTFSLVITNTDGVACLVDSGTQLNFLMNMIPDMQAQRQP